MFKVFYTKKYKYTFIIEKFPSCMIVMHPSYYNGFHKWKTDNGVNISFTLFKIRFLVCKQRLSYENDKYI